MPIHFRCKCGRKLKVDDSMAGKQGQCPSCGRKLIVPEASENEQPQPQPQQAASAGMVTCTACGKPMTATAVVCTSCGFHRVGGTFVRTQQKENEKVRRVLMTLMGMEVTPLRLALVIVPLVAVVIWYLTGPARAIHILDQQTVSVVDLLHGGATREPYSLLSGAGDRSLGIKSAPQQGGQPVPGAATVAQVYSVGSGDQLLVTTPDEAGDYILLEVALKQGVIRDRKQTSKYDSVFHDGQFRLEPAAGAPLTGRLLYVRFEKDVDVDLAGADTSDSDKLLPVIPPDDINVSSQSGVKNGTAVWNQPPLISGKLDFTSYYSTGSMPSTKGLYATGKLTLAPALGHGAAFPGSIEMDYRGDSLHASWPAEATGWWTKARWTRLSRLEPWYRYKFGLLFPRPSIGGKCALVYCDQQVATIKVPDMPAPPQPVSHTPGMVAPSPMKGLQHTNQPPPSNPMTYLSLLAEARSKGRGIVSASNLNQIGIALQMYLDQHRGQWPTELNDLEKVMPGIRQVFANPRTGDNPGFIYEPPPPGADPSQTPILWESLNGQKDPTGAILFADGHIE
ncbi:MAG: hypothetical protein IT445_20205 [Phycisphaeraceae bacterium]|nr:hypothetical protein [Phycisphaeraceae bacterium]